MKAAQKEMGVSINSTGAGKDGGAKVTVTATKKMLELEGALVQVGDQCSCRPCNLAIYSIATTMTFKASKTYFILNMFN